MMRKFILIAVACSLSWSAFAMAENRPSLDVPAGELTTALKTLASQTQVDLVYQLEQVKNFHTDGVTGKYSPQEAVEKLLKGTPLKVYVTENGAMVIAPAEERTSDAAAYSSASGDNGGSGNSQSETNETHWDRLRMAQADQGPSAAVGSAPSSGNSESSALEEVVVTAQKKVERLQDVPVPVTVIIGDDLAATNKTKLEDLLATVPGLTLAKNSTFANGAMVEIRGLGTTAYQNGTAPTIGFMIDGMPYGPSEVIEFGGVNAGIPDIDPSDIARIEVLKGPQGSLYGADSIGGLINIITKDPSTAGISGHVQALGEDIPDGGSGYAVRGAVNIPISNELAVRLSGFDRHSPGYIENVTNDQKNVNSADVHGGHVSLLYRPLDNLSFKFSALLQDNQANGASVINVDQNLRQQLSDLQQTGMPGSGKDLYQLRVYSGAINAKVAGVDVASLTSYNVQRSVDNEDFTGFFAPCCIDKSPLFMSTTPNASNRPSDFTDTKFSQELRLASSFTHWMDWLVGGFYTRESSSGTALITANNPNTGSYLGTYYYEVIGHEGDPPTTLSEESVFGNLTVHITPRFDIQFGGRQSWYQQAFNAMLYGPGYIDFGAGTLLPGAPPPAQKGSDSAFTYLVTPEYKVSRDLMVYARIATGYMIGGTNAPMPGLTIPLTYGPAKTTNYEIGAKGILADGRLVFDLSAYHIDWTQMQVQVYNQFGGWIINAGEAKSQGLEASIQARPIDRLRITATGSYNDAQLTNSFPANDGGVTAPAGTQLPYSMRWSGSLTADMDVVRFGHVTGFAGGTLSYIGQRPGEFQGINGYDRLTLPAFTTVDGHIGLRTGSLEARLYVNNLGNVRGYIGGSGDFGAEGNTGGYYAQVIQPRTIGLSLSMDF